MRRIRCLLASLQQYVRYLGTEDQFGKVNQDSRRWMACKCEGARYPAHFTCCATVHEDAYVRCRKYRGSKTWFTVMCSFSSRLKSLLALGRLLSHCRQLGQMIKRKKVVLNYQATGPFLPSNIDTGLRLYILRLCSNEKPLVNGLLTISTKPRLICKERGAWTSEGFLKLGSLFW